MLRPEIRSLCVVGLAGSSTYDGQLAFLRRLERVILKMSSYRWQAVLVVEEREGEWNETSKRLTTRYPWLTILHVAPSLGDETALKAGLTYAFGDATIIMEAHLGHPPELTPQLLAFWEKGYDVVYAVPRRNAPLSWLKRFRNAALTRLGYWVWATELPLNAGSFCLVARPLVEMARKHTLSIRTLAQWAGFRQVVLPYTRSAGKFEGVPEMDNYGLKKSDFARFFELVEEFWALSPSFLTHLWRGSVVLCALSVVVSLMIALLCLTSRIDPLMGGLASLAFMMGGIQCACLGALGKRLRRRWTCLRARPVYHIHRSYGVLSLTEGATSFSDESDSRAFPLVESQGYLSGSDADLVSSPARLSLT